MQTSTARSFVYVASSGESRRMYETWNADGHLLALVAEQSLEPAVAERRRTRRRSRRSPA